MSAPDLLSRLRGRTAWFPLPSARPLRNLNWFVVSLSDHEPALEYGGVQRGDAPLTGAWGCPPQHDGRVGGKVAPARRWGYAKVASAGEIGGALTPVDIVLEARG